MRLREPQPLHVRESVRVLFHSAYIAGSLLFMEFLLSWDTCFLYLWVTSLDITLCVQLLCSPSMFCSGRFVLLSSYWGYSWYSRRWLDWLTAPATFCFLISLLLAALAWFLVLLLRSPLCYLVVLLLSVCL